MSTSNKTTFSSPIGALLLVSNGTALTDLFLPGAWAPSDARGGSDAVLEEACRQLTAYFAGELRDFDVPLEPQGTPFQRRVWDALLSIPYGTTTSYGQLARELEAPNAARAVGLANGSNPIAIIIPCHRVIGASGTLVGYGGGLPRKRYLLDLEAGGVPLFSLGQHEVVRNEQKLARAHHR